MVPLALGAEHPGKPHKAAAPAFISEAVEEGNQKNAVIVIVRVQTPGQEGGSQDYDQLEEVAGSCRSREFRLA